MHPQQECTYTRSQRATAQHVAPIDHVVESGEADGSGRSVDNHVKSAGNVLKSCATAWDEDERANFTARSYQIFLVWFSNVIVRCKCFG